MFKKLYKKIMNWSYFKKASFLLFSALIILLALYVEFFYSPLTLYSDLKSLLLSLIPSIIILQITLVVTYSYIEKHMDKEKRLEKYKNHINLVRSLFEELIKDNKNELAFRSLKDVSISYDFRKLSGMVQTNVRGTVEETNNILVIHYLNIKNSTNFVEYKEIAKLSDQDISKICEILRNAYNKLLDDY